MEVLKLSADTTRVLRQLLATIAYRASRSLRSAPPGFQNARLPGDGKSAAELLHHMTNVLAFAYAAVTATDRVRHEPVEWAKEIERFYEVIGQVDAKLAVGVSIEAGMDLKLVQGPLADVLTHVGQLHAMRRAAGSPVGATNYIKAEIHIGCTSLIEQPD